MHNAIHNMHHYALDKLRSKPRGGGVRIQKKIKKIWHIWISPLKIFGILLGQLFCVEGSRNWGLGHIWIENAWKFYQFRPFRGRFCSLLDCFLRCIFDAYYACTLCIFSLEIALCIMHFPPSMTLHNIIVHIS